MAAGNNRQYGGVPEETIYVSGSNALNVQQNVQQQPQRPQVSESTRKNRARSLQMNIRYVLFLTAAAVFSVLICVNYIRLLSGYTALQKEGTALETQLSSLKLENDIAYNRIISSVNLEEVKDKAMNEFGMVYASAGQIVTYEAPGSDYVKQYTEVPE